jgi:hypothetical protein
MQLADLVKEYWRPLLEALGGCFFLAATWAAQRTKRWLLEHLDRERLANEELLARQRSAEMRRHNETLRILSEASASVAQPTLESLLANEARDFSLESSQPPSEPPSSPRPSQQTFPRPGVPSTWGRALTPVPTDWSDDDETTTVPETPQAKSRPPPSNPPIAD